MVDWICSYYATVGEMPVRSQVQPGYLAAQLPAEAPEAGEPFVDIMRDVDKKILPGPQMQKQRPMFASCCAKGAPAVSSDMHYIPWLFSCVHHM